MKIKCITLFSACLMAVACDRGVNTTGFSSSDPGGEGNLLITELPPELIEGTPVPILLHHVPPGRVPPASAPGPGTDHVFYVRRSGEPTRPAAIK